ADRRRSLWLAGQRLPVRPLWPTRDPAHAVDTVHRRRTRHGDGAFGAVHGRGALPSGYRRRGRFRHGAGVHRRDRRAFATRKAGQPQRTDDRQRPAVGLRPKRGAGSAAAHARHLALHAGHRHGAGHSAADRHLLPARHQGRRPARSRGDESPGEAGAQARARPRTAASAVDPETAADRRGAGVYRAVHRRQRVHVLHADHPQEHRNGHQRRADRDHRQRHRIGHRHAAGHLGYRPLRASAFADDRPGDRGADAGGPRLRPAVHAAEPDPKLHRAGVHSGVPAVHADVHFTGVLAADVGAVPDAGPRLADRHSGVDAVAVQRHRRVPVPDCRGHDRQPDLLRLRGHQHRLADLRVYLPAGNQGQVP
nr:hypothetical protein [Tanacetum cinerariifolium]